MTNDLIKLMQEHPDYPVVARVDNDVCDYLAPHIEAMREEKEKLTQELIEHGCRRKN